jgi:glycosyltransferase involved in cell wall biosynthesis
VAIDARLLAYQQAGTATYIRGIIAGLQELVGGPDLVVVSSRKDHAAPAPGRQVISWTPCHHRFERWTLGLELAPLNVDVVHSPDFIPPCRFGRRWARVITVHDLGFLKWPELVTPPSRRYYSQIFGAVREADRIVAVSRSTREDLLDLVSESIDHKIAVIPEGVDPWFQPIERSTARERVGQRFQIDRPFFLFVGTIEPRKNLPILLRAFDRFRGNASGREYDLVIAGSRGWLDGELDEALKTYGTSVRLLGRVSVDDLVVLYNASLALVLVSLYEGFGLPAAEAMACATPVIAAKTGSLPEVVGDAGLLVDPRDPDSIVDALHRIAEDASLREDLAARGVLRSASFRWKAVAEQTARAYREAAACVS